MAFSPHQTTRSAILRPRFPPTLRSVLAALKSQWRVYLAIFAFALTASIIRSSHTAFQSTATLKLSAQITMLLTMAIVIVMFLGSLTIFKRFPLEKLYLVAATFIAFILILAPLCGPLNAPFGYLSNALYNIQNVVIWCLLAFIARATKQDPLLVFSFGQACNYTGMIAGSLAGFHSFVFSLFDGYSTLAIVLAVFVLICSVLIFGEKNFVQILEDASANNLNFHRIIQTVRLDDAPATKRMGRWAQVCLRVGERAQLSEREQEILRQLADNRTPNDIASYLNISVNTVRTHTKNVYAKLSVHSRDELIQTIRNEYDGQ